jgi:hypothetical protein
MSDFAELRQLALQITQEIEQGASPQTKLPSKVTTNQQAFRAEVLRRLRDFLNDQSRAFTVQERDLLDYVYNKNKQVPAAQVAEQLAWIARGPNAFHWGPWFPYQDP